MSRLDDLINEYCPEGVEYKRLSEITNLSAGKRITKEMMNDNLEYDVYGGGVQPTGKYSKYNEMHSITISRAGSAGFVNWVEDKFWATDVCFVASELCEEYNIKFIYYYVKNQQTELQKHIYGGNLPKLNKDYLWNLLVPVPPLPVQEEIVRILDTFTELTTKLNNELTLELTLRKKQYEYYRDGLLKFGEEVEIYNLADITDIVRGKRVVRSQLSENEGYPVYQNSMVPLGYYDQYNVSKDTTFIIAAGAAGEIGYSYNKFWAADDCFYFKCDDRLIDRYLYHSLMNKQDEIKRRVRKASIPRISRESIEKIKIPLPSLKIQERIVYVLDYFDKVCNDLNIGLPAEIEARNKQYEYYRDQLLNMKEWTE